MQERKDRTKRDRKDEVTDELAARRAAKGILSVKISAGEASVVRHVTTRPIKPRRETKG